MNSGVGAAGRHRPGGSQRSLETAVPVPATEVFGKLGRGASGGQKGKVSLGSHRTGKTTSSLIQQVGTATGRSVDAGRCLVYVQVCSQSEVCSPW